LKRQIRRSLIPAVFVTVIGVIAGAPAAAQDYTWTLSFQGGLGGSLRDGGGSEVGFQGGIGLQFEPQANVWAHVGQLDFDTGSDVGDLIDGTITYVTVGGEYQFAEGYYDSGIFMGLGIYDLEASRKLAEDVIAAPTSDSVIGIVVGATGEFKFTPSVVLLAEVSGHILDSSDTRVLGTIHIGLGFHF